MRYCRRLMLAPAAIIDFLFLAIVVLANFMDAPLAEGTITQDRVWTCSGHMVIITHSKIYVNTETTDFCGPSLGAVFSMVLFWTGSSSS